MTPNNPTWKSTLDLSIVTFGRNGVQSLDLRNGGTATTAEDAFATIKDVVAPTLHAGGVTPMLEAIQTGLDLLAGYKRYLRQNGYDFYRPYQVLITDGYPTDREGEFTEAGVAEVAARLVSEQNGRHVLFRAFNVPGANTDVLARLAGHASAVTSVDDVDWGRILELVSNSVQTVLGDRPRSPSETPILPRSDQLDPEIANEQDSLLTSIKAQTGFDF